MKLLEPYQSMSLGYLKNRIAMAPMTRGFANSKHCATDEMAEYYHKRAKGGVGLIITEGTVVHHSGDGFPSVPRMETSEQSASWSRVINRVHESGSKIICQLWHCGRLAFPCFSDGANPIGPSDIPAKGINRYTNTEYLKPIPLHSSDIILIQEYFARAADRCHRIGFDGIQLHMGHGYLFEQFFDSGINSRTDLYGGAIENRCRIAIELLKMLKRNLDMEKVVLRISPVRQVNNVLIEWPEKNDMLEYFCRSVYEQGVRLLDVSCANSNYYETSQKVIEYIRPFWNGEIMGGASLTPSMAEIEIDSNRLDLITWGRLLLANEDFVQKIKLGVPLTEFHSELLKKLK